MTTARDALIQTLCATPSVGNRFQGLRPLTNGSTGNFSIVLEASDAQSGKDVVLKFLNPFERNKYRIASFDREGDILQSMQGRENMLQIIHGPDDHVLHLTDVATGAQFPVGMRFIALERAKSDLARFFLDPNPPRLGRRVEVIRDLARAVERLHNHRFCHRDIRPENVFLFPGGIVKVGDFGTCRGLDAALPTLAAIYVGPVGDLRYTAPEMIFGGWDDPSLFRAADWFSVGAILFEALAGFDIYTVLGLRNQLVPIISHLNTMPAAARLATYSGLVSGASGRFPLPSLHDFAGAAVLKEWSPRVITKADGLTRALCHFDAGARLVGLDRLLPQVDLLLAHVRYEDRTRSGWQRRHERLQAFK